MLRENESLSKRSKRPAPSFAHDSLYFSAWYWTAIHFLTSIREFQTVGAIANHLKLPPTLVQKCLEQLAVWDFVSRIGKNWKYKGGEFHLPKNSPMVLLHHNNWRQQAVVDAQFVNNDSIHYTNVHTISHSNLPVLKERILKFISESNELFRSSREEDCVVLLCDLFKLG